MFPGFYQRGRVPCTQKPSSHATLTLTHFVYTLMNLIAANADFLSWRQRLDTFVNNWEALGRDPGLLLGPSLLSLYVPWRDGRRDDLSEAELAYIAASETAAEAELACIAASETAASERPQPTRTLKDFVYVNFVYILGLLVAMGGIIVLILFLLGRW
jgi:hypothetical protein